MTTRASSAPALLRLGHKVICFTDALSPSAARAYLERAGVTVGAALASGRLRILAAAPA